MTRKYGTGSSILTKKRTGTDFLGFSMKEEINSSEALVAYLDVLGYSNLVHQEGIGANFYHGAIDAAISRWHRFLEKHQYNWGDVVRRYTTLEVIGDAFVVVFDQERALSEEGLREDEKALMLMVFLTLLSFLVQDCSRAVERLFRGAVVRGKHYQREFENLESSTFVFSRGLCDAHELAENIADVPRILVDKSVLAGLDISVLIMEERPDRELLRDTDGLYFLNIYSSVFCDTALAPILREIASVVGKSMADIKELKITQKYIWFANYHNGVVQQIIDLSPSIPSFDEIQRNQTSMLIEIPSL